MSNIINDLENSIQDDKKIQIIYTGGTFLSTEFEDGARAIGNINEKLPTILTSTMNELKKLFNIKETEIYKIDSSDLSLDHLYKIKNFIKNSEKKNKNSISDYIIIHGTDTMEYTASYLSFIFPNLKKNIILTGSMIPVGAKNSDAIPNLFKSLLISKQKKSGVSVVFGDKCIRGVNASKQDSVGVNAFDSVNYPSQFNIITNPYFSGDPITNTLNDNEYIFQGNKYIITKNEIEEKQLLSQYVDENSSKDLLDTLNANIDIVTLFPGYDYNNFNAYIENGIEGLIVRGYGDGNVPQNKEFYKKIESLKNNGVLVILETQVPNGKLVHNYEGARNLIDNNLAISAENLSHSTVVMKLMFALGSKNKKITEEKNISIQEALEYTKKIFKQDYVGEYFKLKY